MSKLKIIPNPNSDKIIYIKRASREFLGPAFIASVSMNILAGAIIILLLLK